jgi:hypothetical protein
VLADLLTSGSAGRGEGASSTGEGAAPNAGSALIPNNNITMPQAANVEPIFRRSIAVISFSLIDPSLRSCCDRMCFSLRQPGALLLLSVDFQPVGRKTTDEE